jgi:hypothetical protein
VRHRWTRTGRNEARRGRRRLPARRGRRRKLSNLSPPSPRRSGHHRQGPDTSQDPAPGRRSRQRSPFSATYSATKSLLYREITALGATSAVLQLAVTESDIRLDGDLRANARPTHPGVIVSFESRHGPLRYACDRFLTWQDNVRAIALGLESLRRVDRYGIAGRGEQYTGWKALPAGNGAPSPERGRALIARHGGVRQALHATHPDHGGDPADFADVQAARGALA